MRVLIVGSGFVGQAVAAAVERDGGHAVLASRRPVPGTARWVRLDATDPAGCAQAVQRVRPDAVVAVHGPSDVTWCEQQPAAALAAHRDATRNLVRALGRTRLVLISTDNVFDGRSPDNDEETATAPANAYGAAKLAAEAELAGHPDATVLRVSLVYGPETARPGKRTNFAAACVRGWQADEVVPAPVDQWTTPVHVADVAAVTLAAVRGAPPLLHLGGPERISRFDWAHRLAARLGYPAALIGPVTRDSGPYACRPANSCLTSRLLPASLDAWRLRVRGVDEGADGLVAAVAG
ncbi:SDR family oxidoreductase [Hamadaea tsunoensis]|uniref:SDR family oxidoreductase n=1 Tax=Hamadaea tsunoensis TaxID=53368 RepID=UPI000A037120|nr:sugar nucleotide-binding protein [Hamadaea tsunoensis]